MSPQRIADVAHAGACGALLFPGLPPAATDKRAVLARVRAAMLRRIGVHNRLPDERAVDAATEHFVLQLDRADLLVLCVDDVNLHSFQFSVFSFRLPELTTEN